MATINVLDAMKSIDKTLSGISSPAARDRVLKWAWAKFSPMPRVVPAQDQITTAANSKIRKRKSVRRRASTEYLDL